MLVCSLLSMSRERLANDVLDTCGTHVGLVHDITGRKEGRKEGNKLVFYAQLTKTVIDS